MRFVIQRVNHAKCTIDGNITGSIEKGLCVLIGIAETDTKEIADKMIKKLINMRIFADENDKTNLSINDVDGKLLLISQFTLYASCNVSLAVFNFIPIPPLDGSKILFAFLPYKAIAFMTKYETIFSLALIFLIFTGGLSTVLGFATNGILNFLSDMALSPVRFFAELF